MKCSRALGATVFLILFFTSICSFGAEFCVDNAVNLQTALSTAQSNGQSDVVKVVQGNYNGNFLYSSSEGYSLTLLGGYTGGCAGRVVDPANTVLDGGGNGRVLDLNHFDGGDFVVDGFTLQNGDTATDGGGAYAESQSNAGTAGDVTFTNNIVRMNTAAQTGGGVFARSYSHDGTAAKVVLVNNLVTGNSANLGGGVFASSYSVTGTPGSVTLTNNTVTGNSANSNDYGGGGAYLYANSSQMPGGTVNCYNNIIWGNTGPTAADINVDNTAESTTNGYNNDYSVMSGSWDNGVGTNIDQDPLFTGTYHLKPRSPCIDTGTNSAPELPATDIEGNNRIIDGDRNHTPTVDMGAYEYVPGAKSSPSLLLLLD